MRPLEPCMSLTAGVRVGSYEVLSVLGAGGMGEVYRARDTKLGRSVAIKIVSDAFTHDPDRIARFQREAQLLAALNHPHIATIHGLEQADGSQFMIKPAANPVWVRRLRIWWLCRDWFEELKRLVPTR